MSEATLWYFAYGSNLSKMQMECRIGYVPDAKKARLAGYRLAFNKEGGGQVYANIVPDKDGEVWGVVYRCRPADLDKLDQYEGVMTGHYRRCRYPVEADGEILEAEVYVAEDRFVGPEKAPRQDYLQKILTGASEHGLPASYIEGVRQRVHSLPGD